jgi:RimJ/RimL family protein N-acetyltransferase
MQIETARLTLREMADTDLDAMADLLGDPKVMSYYQRPKTRAEALGWISWNQASYREHGFGLWIIETHDGQFVGDCGLTMQEVEGRHDVEVGYHVRVEYQNRGLATEAAIASQQFAIRLGVERLIAIIDPRNVPSQRVAENLGLSFERTAVAFGKPVWIYAAPLPASPPVNCHETEYWLRRKAIVRRDVLRM